jgi:hypothetical protein
VASYLRVLRLCVCVVGIEFLLGEGGWIRLGEGGEGRGKEEKKE